MLLAMSGGIDSTVSALLLLEQGYEVVGCTFRTYDSIKESCLVRQKGCCDIESILEAKKNAERMGFDHHIVDYREVFREKVIGNFIDEYGHGRTPNPCVLCNRYIKGELLAQTADEYGCDYIATGHYARIEKRMVEGQERNLLGLPVDRTKDQTYFLWQMPQSTLARMIFPLANLTKPEVREIARARGFEKVAQKPESQDICFITGGDYRAFLEREASELLNRPGQMIDKEGKVIAQHPGCAHFTIGQRKGLGVALGYPAFVTGIDPEKNEVRLGRREDLYRHQVRIENAYFYGDATRPVQAKIRYRSEAVEATIEKDKEGYILLPKEPVWAPTPGQSCVIYQDELLVGGGIIV